MRKRLFIAIKINPTKEILHRVSLFQENLDDDNINWIRADHYHLTLKFLGDTSSEKIERMAEKLIRILQEEPAFRLKLSKFGLFGSKYSPRVIWAGVEPELEVGKLAQKISKEMESFGYRNDRQNFVPHLTVARIRKLKNKAHFQQVFSKLHSAVRLEQLVDEVVLFESRLSSQGAEYSELARFPLKID
ncbi:MULTISPECIES: RNA 2',3'-cyclic phosphodiesterase [unclassified Lentimicrobium]|uniref:RNA 2',3'-cyclic phosphodiesterase n=1 Tax=unclassified Lentimicrobium TaxID=2677434 RepID=UPI001556E2B4|nr:MULTISPECIES: RNA 2',3'-cyclic phosphodiesterase [unclassified Lentimicrobium]NPD46980.1 RNA 2',3'-cyclic phosphodiesterase [Lentimicrobium sp. S6]NPD83927.1 RNA 2',3'-cyclic phosphodiesterase [Lentimicrobium sp. L6]